MPVPTARPFLSAPSSFSQPLSPGGGGGGLVRKVSARIQQAIEAAKVPYQPVYPGPIYEESQQGGYQYGRSVDLHGELRDEWAIGPDLPEQIPLRISDPEINHNTPKDSFRAGTKVEINQLDEDAKYLVNYATDDMRHPYNWPKSKKYSILLILCLAAVCVTATSSIQASTYASIEREFNLSRPEAVLGVSLYVLGLGIGSSEFYLAEPWRSGT
jgi:hypothetical protein